MTISSTISRNDYTGAGSVGPFVYAFKVYAPTDLQVLTRTAAGLETTLTYLTDYTVTGAGNDAGGTITLIVALPVGSTLTVRRKFPLTQPASLRNQGSYFPETIEDQLDRAVGMLQQHQDAIDRSVKLAPSLNPAGKALTLSPSTAGQAVVSDGAGGVTLATLDASAVALPGNGRTTTTLSAYLANNAVANVRDFGAKGDGVTDDIVAFENAMASLPMELGVTSTGGKVLVPAGVYRMSRSLNITRAVWMQGEFGASWSSASDLVFDAGVAGVIVSTVATSACVLDSLQIGAAGKTTVGKHGVTMIRRANIFRCRIAGFTGNGIHIDADSVSSGGVQNANLWRVQDSFCDSNTGHGLYVHGGDSNAGLAMGNSFGSNGGWGVYENSFLGNTYIGNHAELNTLGGYTAIGSVNNSLFVGNYSESGQPANAIASQSMWLGGAAHQLTGTGTRVDKGTSVNLTLGSEAWTTDGGLQGAWTNVGGTNATAAVRVDGSGEVHLKGMVQGGTVGSQIMVLTGARRPLEDTYFSCPAVNGATGVAIVVVTAGGGVSLSAYSGVASPQISLNSIRFTSNAFVGVV